MTITESIKDYVRKNMPDDKHIDWCLSPRAFKRFKEESGYSNGDYERFIIYSGGQRISVVANKYTPYFVEAERKPLPPDFKLWEL